MFLKLKIPNQEISLYLTYCGVISLIKHYGNLIHLIILKEKNKNRWYLIIWYDHFSSVMSIFISICSLQLQSWDVQYTTPFS